MANVGVRNDRVLAQPLRWRELWLKEDWWAIWLGLGIVAVAYALFANGSSIKWLAVTPAKWSTFAQLSAHFTGNFDRYLAQFIVWIAIFSVALTALGHKAKEFIPSFVVLYVLSVAIFAVGQWDKANTYNLEPPLVALLVGLALSNLIGLPRWLDAGFRVEFYIKTGIVLLGATLPFTLIVWAGPVAILQASIVSIVTFVVIYRGTPSSSASTSALRPPWARAARCAACPRRLQSPAPSAQKGRCADRHHHGDHLGDGDDLRAALRRAGAASAGRRRRRLDRHLGIRRRGRLRRGADLRRPRKPWRRRRHQRPGRLRLHADQGGRPRRLDRHLGLRARHHRDHAVGARQTGRKPEAAEIWWRFPKFVIGFLVASLIVTLATTGYSLADYNKTVVPSLVGPIKDLRSWAFIFCFLSIGLTTRFRELATAGTKPFLAFSAGAIVNIVVGFVLSALVFASHWENLAR